MDIQTGRKHQFPTDFTQFNSVIPDWNRRLFRKPSSAETSSSIKKRFKFFCNWNIPACSGRQRLLLDKLRTFSLRNLNYWKKFTSTKFTKKVSFRSFFNTCIRQFIRRNAFNDNGTTTLHHDHAFCTMHMTPYDSSFFTYIQCYIKHTQFQLFPVILAASLQYGKRASNFGTMLTTVSSFLIFRQITASKTIDHKDLAICVYHIYSHINAPLCFVDQRLRWGWSVTFVFDARQKFDPVDVFFREAFVLRNTEPTRRNICSISFRSNR